MFWVSIETKKYRTHKVTGRFNQMQQMLGKISYNLGTRLQVWASKSFKPEIHGDYATTAAFISKVPNRKKNKYQSNNRSILIHSTRRHRCQISMHDTFHVLFFILLKHNIAKVQNISKALTKYFPYFKNWL